MDISEIAPVWSNGPMPAPSPGAKPNPAELQKATREFEALLLRQFLGQALKPILHESLGANAPGAHIYQHMMTDAIAGQLAAEETFGMSSLLQIQLSGESSGTDRKDIEAN